MKFLKCLSNCEDLKNTGHHGEIMLEKCCQVQIKQQIRTQIKDGKEGLK